MRKLFSYQITKNVIYIILIVSLLYTLQDILFSGRLHLLSDITLALTIITATILTFIYQDKISGLVKQRQFKSGINFLILIVISFAIFVFIFLLAQNHNAQFDTTRNTRYTLAPQSQKVIKNLKNDVKIYGFYGIYQERYEFSRQGMDDLLQQYTLHGSKVSYRLYNINKEPDMAEKYEVKVPGTLVVTSGAKKELIQEIDEQSITNAIIRVSREREKKIYFLTGHNEKSKEQKPIKSIALLYLELENLSIKTEELNIPQTGGVVPTDCDLLIIAGPESDLFPIEWKAVVQYLKRGGNLLLMVDPPQANEFRSRLTTFGINLGNDILVMEELSLVDYATGNYYSVITNNYGNHEITTDFDLSIIFDQARSVKSADKLPEGIVASTLVSSLSNAHVENLIPIPGNVHQMQRSGKRDIPGPVPIGVALTLNTEKWVPPDIKLDRPQEAGIQSENIKGPDAIKKDDSKTGSYEVGEKKAESRIVILGDSDFILDGYLRRSRGNRDFILNTISWLMHEKELISIRPRSPENTPIVLSEKQSKVILWVVVIILPVLILIIGGSNIRKRKKGTS